MPTIEIELKNRIIEITLKDGKKILDSLTFEEKSNLTERLLLMVDKLIRKNKLQIKDIQKITTKSDLGEPFMSYRILKVVEKTFQMSNL